MKTASKTFLPFEVKQVDEAGRTFRGLAAAWSLDLGGDVIRKGAFAKTLTDWRNAKQRPIYLIDQHNYMSVNNVIGKMTDAAENELGLEATFSVIADDAAADAAFKRIKGGYITGLSIGYEPIRWEYQSQGEKRVRLLTEVKLLEVSLVIFPMNEDARIDTAGVKMFRQLFGLDRLTDEQRKQFAALLTDESAAGNERTPAPTEPKGIAPDDPRRTAVEAMIRDMTVRSLATR